MNRKQWFCTKCKAKFESDRDHPHCLICDSGYVLNNEVAALDKDTGKQ